MTSGLFHTLTDVCLFTIFLQAEVIGTYRSRKDFFEAIFNAVQLTRITNAHNFKRLIHKLKYKGYLEKKKDYYKITQIGREKLNQTLPKYQKDRPWDGKLYLITYDIPEERKKDRDYLRRYLRKIGGGMLQHSVWLTPYNPKGLVVDFVRQTGLGGLILVSELKEGSGIGGRDIFQVVEEVYKLDKLNQEYWRFIERVEDKKLSGVELMMDYLAMLKKDPQLPFDLLPQDWFGDEAFDLYEKELIKMRKSLLTAARPRASE